ncbi:MAG: hypothetical protein ACXVAC_19265 [Vulcanimicrobiaceae bacterium]
MLGAAIAGAIAQRFIDVRSALHLSDLAGSVTLARPDVASFVMQHGNAHALAALLAQQSLVLAYGDAMRIFGIVALFIIPIIYYIPLPKLQTESVELAVPRADE